MSFAPDGTAHAIALAASLSADNTALQFSGVFVSKSTDGGDTWSPAIPLKEDADAAFFNDKELITADPTSSRRVYAVWDRTNEQGGQPVWFSRTLNGGRMWEPAKIIYDPTPRFTISNQIAVLPDGTLIDMFFEGPAGVGEEPGIAPSGKATPASSPDEARVRLPQRALQLEDENVIRIIRSTDHGKTWSKPITVRIGTTPASGWPGGGVRDFLSLTHCRGLSSPGRCLYAGGRQDSTRWRRVRR